MNSSELGLLTGLGCIVLFGIYSIYSNIPLIIPDPDAKPQFIKSDSIYDLNIDMRNVSADKLLIIAKSGCNLTNETDEYFIFNCTCFFPEDCEDHVLNPYSDMPRVWKR